MRNRSKFGYFPEESKSNFIVKKEIEEETVLRLQQEGVNFKVVNGNRYLGGFVGDKEKEREWIEEKVKDWVTAVEAVAEVARFAPQSAYADIQIALQQEWTFVQRVVPNIDVFFIPLESSIQSKFFWNHLEKL